VATECIRPRALASALLAALILATSASAADPPRYDVPAGFIRCPRATAWNGFFKWASVDRTSCRYAADFMRAYARAVPPDGKKGCSRRGELQSRCASDPAGRTGHDHSLSHSHILQSAVMSHLPPSVLTIPARCL